MNCQDETPGIPDKKNGLPRGSPFSGKVCVDHEYIVLLSQC
ncbi:Uncharacterized protein dnl_39930 [Desulfonema limicola]|uniref:Uncharacterized protein n=1 Tax=Desulfonema limicola TaxID=45656 RepID=A0A975BAL1_9BACT|nr:Uncharacterized protein dnl_39930 [Desulfonema limicola]